MSKLCNDKCTPNRLCIFCFGIFRSREGRSSEFEDLTREDHLVIYASVTPGATFMAAGSSAPELFSSLMSLTNNHASNEIGIGTIVGSAVFNILVIIGVTAIFAGKTLHLDWRPLARDAFFYSASIFGIIGIFNDEKVFWWVLNCSRITKFQLLIIDRCRRVIVVSQ